MDPNRTTGEDAPARQEGNATATNTEAGDADNDSQQTLACRDCDSTNIRAIQGETGVGASPIAEGPYACNDCGWHGEPRTREKQTSGEGRRGLAGQLASADADDLRADGGSECARLGADRRPGYCEHSIVRTLYGPLFNGGEK